MYVNSPAFDAGMLRSFCRIISGCLFFVLRRLAIGIDFGIILGLFWPTISLNKSLPRSLPCWRIRPFLRTPLHNLLPLVDPEVISVSFQCPSQGLYRYDQFCFHLFKIFCLKLWGPQTIINFWGERRRKLPLSISGVVWSLQSCCRTRSHHVRIAYVTVRLQ